MHAQVTIMIYLISANKIGTTNGDKFDEAYEYELLDYMQCKRILERRKTSTKSIFLNTVFVIVQRMFIVCSPNIDSE